MAAEPLGAGVAAAPAPIGAGAPRSRARRAARPLGLSLVFLLWFVTWWDPHRFLATIFGSPLLQVPLVFYVLLALLLFLRWKPRGLYPQFVAFFLSLAVMVPFAINRGVARKSLKFIILEYILLLGTIRFARSFRDFTLILTLAALSFLWFAILGDVEGYVLWHPILGNEDGFAPVMLMGACMTYYMALGASDRRWQRALLVTALLCVFGLVTSFTRGATLSAGVVGLLLWARSPHKLRTGLALAVGTALLVVAAELLFPGGKFWAEMRSVFTEGTSSGTGSDRWVLWQAAIRVWKERPIFGVGPSNFGIFASQLFEHGEAGGDYANPVTLYGRDLHSIYFQLLSEAGIVGVVAFIVLIADFWRRNLALRRPVAEAVWRDLGGTRFRLRFVSLGLELAMIAQLLNGLWYPLLYIHWFYSLLFLNYAIHTSVERALNSGVAFPPAPARRRP